MRYNPNVLLLFTFYQLVLKMVLAEAPKQIIITLIDDLGPGDIRIDIKESKRKYNIRTPAFDKLKKSSALFPNTIGATLCGPSRASLLTGRPIGYSKIRGNPDNLKNLPRPEITLPKALQLMNYTVTMAGKWGFGACNTNWGIRKFGVDESLVFDTHKQAHQPFPPSLSKSCENINYPKNKITTRTKCLNKQCTSAEDESLKFIISKIKKCAEHKLYCAHFYMPISPHVGTYSGKSRLTTPVTSYAGYPSTWNVDYRGYAAMVTLLDARVKSIIDTLDNLNIFNSTLLILLSDNGAERKYVNYRPQFGVDPFDSTGGRKGLKRSMYQGGINTPMLVNWPDKIPPRVSNYPLASFDLTKTILKLLDAPATLMDKFTPPAGIIEGTPVSLDQLWLYGDDYAPKRNYIFTENCEGGEASCTFAVYNVSNWRRSIPKLVYNATNQPRELYELNSDPNESKNLINNPGQQAIANAMYNAWKANRQPKLW